MSARLPAVLGAALLIPLLGAAPAAGGIGPMSDPAGDANGGMDITMVAIEEQPTGAVTFAVTAVPVVGSIMFVAVDVDGNGSTGDAVDRILIADVTAPGVVVASSGVFGADGSLISVQVPGYTAVPTATGIDFTFEPRALGAGTLISFWLATLHPVSGDIADVAPGNNTAWGYALGPTSSRRIPSSAGPTRPP